jgi:hypothetical protein
VISYRVVVLYVCAEIDGRVPLFEFDHGRRVAQLCRRPWREADEAELISRDLGLLLLHTSSRFVSLGTDPCIGWGQNGTVHGQMIGIKLARSLGWLVRFSSPLRGPAPTLLY